MTATVKGRRRSGERRAEQAAQTRRRVLGAASDLFQKHGYASTTVIMIATGARVAPETVYKAFGSKRQVLQELIDSSVVGASARLPKGVIESEAFQSIGREPAQRRRLAMLAHLTRTILERAGPVHAIIRSAAATDPEIAALRAQQQRDRLRGQREFVRILAEAGPLRDGLDREDAAYQYWILASPELQHILVSEQGWSHDRYEAWLFMSLETSLLPPAALAAGR